MRATPLPGNGGRLRCCTQARSTRAQAGGGRACRAVTDTLPPIAKTFAADLQGKGLPGDQVLHGFMDGLKKAGAQPPRDWAGK